LLKTFTSTSVEKYSRAEAQIKNSAHELTAESNLLRKALDARMASESYEFYNNTVGLGGFLIDII
jgi:predicted Zn-dependent protease